MSRKDISVSQLIVGIGSTVVDQQMFLGRIPQENEKERATSLRQQIGGPVPTALVMLKRFGFDCHLISPWGADSNGAEIEADLRREGLSMSESCRAPDRATGTAHVWTSTENGSRTIVAAQSSWNGLQLSANDVRCLRECKLLHLDGTGGDVAVEAARYAQSAGSLITVDAGSPKEATSQLIPLADVFSFPERFAAQFFGDADIESAGHQILQLGAKAAVCTQGEHGATIFQSDESSRVPAFPVETIDSTGAGDVFCGALIAGLLQEYDLSAAVKFGAAAAALKCKSVGNRDSLPSMEMVLDLQRSGLE